MSRLIDQRLEFYNAQFHGNGLDRLENVGRNGTRRGRGRGRERERGRGDFGDRMQGNMADEELDLNEYEMMVIIKG